jgi:hypothetical protein
MGPESTAGRAVALASAVLLVGGARLGLTLAPFGLVARVSERLARGPAWLPPEHAARIGHRVVRVARWVPGASCLTQALAAHVLLAWHGHASTVRYGVRPGATGLDAHAWVEHDGAVVVGGPDVGAFIPLERAQARHAR